MLKKRCPQLLQPRRQSPSTRIAIAELILQNLRKNIGTNRFLERRSSPKLPANILVVCNTSCLNVTPITDVTQQVMGIPTVLQLCHPLSIFSTVALAKLITFVVRPISKTKTHTMMTGYLSVPMHNQSRSSTLSHYPLRLSRVSMFRSYGDVSIA